MKRSISLATGRCHVKVTTLLVPGKNDSEEEIRSLARWTGIFLCACPGSFPRYRMMNRPPTPVERVYRLADVTREHLSFVYTGNC